MTDLPAAATPDFPEAFEIWLDQVRAQLGGEAFSKVGAFFLWKDGASIEDAVLTLRGL